MRHSMGWMMWPLLMLAGVLAAGASEPAGKFEALLVWGTNDPAPEDPAVKPVDSETSRKLGTLPLKWKYYYEVERKSFEVDSGKRRRVTMSKECDIVVRAVQGDTTELVLYGKGKMVGKMTQSLPKGQMLVTGGDAENLSSWFVVLRRAD